MFAGLLFCHVLFWILGFVVKAFASEVLMLFSTTMMTCMNISLFVTAHGLLKTTQVVSTVVVQL